MFITHRKQTIINKIKIALHFILNIVYYEKPRTKGGEFIEMEIKEKKKTNGANVVIPVKTSVQMKKWFEERSLVEGYDGVSSMIRQVLINYQKNVKKLQQKAKTDKENWI